MAQINIQSINHYCKFSDARGEFQGILNYGSWQEVNLVRTHALSMRGGHFHRQSTEVIFMVQGKAELELAPCDDLGDKALITLLAGEGVQIPPLTVHTFYYPESSTHLQFLDIRFDPNHPDLFTVD